jgi:hypothetical protein
MFPLEEKCYRRLVFDEEDEYLDYIQQLDSLLVVSPGSCHLLNNRGVAFYEIGEHDKTRAQKVRVEVGLMHKSLIDVL